jgi:hypothetical protein
VLGGRGVRGTELGRAVRSHPSAWLWR